ncbi:MAG TPA: YibE/F family protein [Acidimicrobiia bacterium]
MSVLVLTLLAVVAVVLLRPGDPPDVSGFGFAPEVLSARVTRVVEGACSFGEDLVCRRATFELLEGPDVGTTTFEEWELIASAPQFAVGDKVVLNRIPEAPALQRYQFADRERRPLLIGAGLLFAALVIVLGRLRGLAALGGLILSIGVLLLYIVPAILSGRSPELVALTGGMLIAVCALYLAHGNRPTTHVAAIGTFASLGLTVGLGALAMRIADFSGLVSEEAGFLLGIGGIDLRGLLLAGIMLGALGALDDVTVTQASAVSEVAVANPALDHAGLYAAGMRVGRDHVASTINTLLLAYAGAAMPLLLLFGLSGQELGIVANSEVVAVEIVRTLVGSIGLVTAVPITTWLAAKVVANRFGRAESS